MICFDCDWCGRTKAANEVWILGLAAEAVGITAARREVTILPAWNRDTAVHPLAVHFCSEECKNDYMARLFGNEPAMASDAVVETRTRQRARPSSRGSSANLKSRKRKRAA